MRGADAVARNVKANHILVYADREWKVDLRFPGTVMVAPNFPTSNDPDEYKKECALAREAWVKACELYGQARP